MTEKEFSAINEAEGRRKIVVTKRERMIDDRFMPFIRMTLEIPIEVFQDLRYAGFSDEQVLDAIKDKIRESLNQPSVPTNGCGQ